MIFKKPGVSVAVMAAVAVVCGASIACSEAASDAAAADATGGDVVAQVGERKITEKELDAAVKLKDAKAYQAFYDARRAVLEDLIRTELLETETSSRGITQEELLAEASKDIAPVTDAEVEKFFNTNTSRMGGRTLEQMQPQIRTYLENTAQQEVANTTIDALKKKYGVKLMLQPPRMEVEIAANDPTYGPEDAAIVIVEFSDFQ